MISNNLLKEMLIQTLTLIYTIPFEEFSEDVNMNKNFSISIITQNIDTTSVIIMISHD